MPIHSDFKTKFTLEERKQECAKMIAKFPDRIPIIVERSKDASIPEMDRKKFLVPSDIVFGQFQSIIRKRININQATALFLFVGNNDRMIPISQLISNVYEAEKDQDGFLYIVYTSENTFG